MLYERLIYLPPKVELFAGTHRGAKLVLAFLELPSLGMLTSMTTL